MLVSCIAGFSYGGSDDAILKRHYELGLGNECDQKPAIVDGTLEGMQCKKPYLLRVFDRLFRHRRGY
ncbi:MAG: hypothetical protein V4722_04660 [Bacteroidota bacterium]